MPEMTAYAQECCKRCEWCKGVGSSAVRHVGGKGTMHHALGHLNVVPCTAPTLAQFSEEQAAELSILRAGVEAVGSLPRQIIDPLRADDFADAYNTAIDDAKEAMRSAMESVKVKK